MSGWIIPLSDLLSTMQTSLRSNLAQAAFNWSSQTVSLWRATSLGFRFWRAGTT